MAFSNFLFFNLFLILYCTFIIYTSQTVPSEVTHTRIGQSPPLSALNREPEQCNYGPLIGPVFSKAGLAGRANPPGLDFFVFLKKENPLKSQSKLSNKNCLFVLLASASVICSGLSDYSIFRSILSSNLNCEVTLMDSKVEGTEAQKFVWEGAIPIQIHLHDSEVTTLPNPPPALVLNFSFFFLLFCRYKWLFED